MKTIASLFGCLCVLVTGTAVLAQGQHVGEVKQLAVDISFYNSAGRTVTDAQGTQFCFYEGNDCYREPQVYPAQYWGTFPLYFIDSRVGVTITVTNNGPRQTVKLRVKTEAYILLTDGTNSDQLMAPQTTEFTVNRGETKTIDASFVVPYTPNTTSGLDRFIVKVLHVNEGGGPGNAEPALIMTKEGIFCPPKRMTK